MKKLYIKPICRSVNIDMPVVLNNTSSFYGDEEMEENDEAAVRRSRFGIFDDDE